MKQKAIRGFTLVELLIYAAVFSITAGLLTSILVMVSNIQTKENASFEVTRQLQFVTQTIQYAIRDASVIESVYEGTNPAAPCASFCTVRLRVTDPLLDPTIISSDAGGVYIQEGANPKVALTSPSVKINGLTFNKIDNPGGISTVTVDLALVYDGGSPELTISKALSSAIAHVSAATFDSDLLPDTDGGRSIGGSSLKWRQVISSEGLIVQGTGAAGFNSGITMRRGAGATHGESIFVQYYDDLPTPDTYGTRLEVGGTPMLYLEADSGTSTRRAYLLNGSLGIGTSTPSSLLHIQGSSDTQALVSTVGTTNAAILYLLSGSGTTSGRYSYIRMGSSETSSREWRLGMYGDQNLTVRDNTAAANRLIIDTSGNIGVGAAPGFKLDVSGDLRITGTPYRNGGDTAWVVPSDARLKVVSSDYESGLEEITALTPVRYRYKPNEALRLDDSKEYVGVIAQEAEKAVPESVGKDKDGYLTLNTTPIFWAMVNAIKELGRSDEDLRVELKKKEEELAALKIRLEMLEARVEK